jgi:hypothetical protein
MSWESYEREQPCRCGKGKLKSTWSSDDWGQSTPVVETIVCDDCSAQYVLVPVLSCKDRGTSWLRKEDLPAYEAKKKELGY